MQAVSTSSKCPDTAIPCCEGLTTQELHAIQLLADGVHRKQFLNRSASWKTFLRAKKKLGAKSSYHLIAIAFRKGLIA